MIFSRFARRLDPFALPRTLFLLSRPTGVSFTRQDRRSLTSNPLKYSFGYQNYGHRHNVRPPGHQFVHYVQLVFVLVGAYGLFYLTNVTEFEDRWTQSNHQSASIEANKFAELNNDQSQDELRLFSRVKAASRPVDSIEDHNLSDRSKLDDKQTKLSFRDKKKIAYENRLRSYSTPDKIFRYFATMKLYSDENPDGIILMTPEDFLRSITPGWKQEDGLELDKFIRVDRRSNRPVVFESNDNAQTSSIFEQIGGKQCLLTFSDFVFLLTVLSTPRRYFKIAFQMFDLDGNGNLDFDEFSKLKDLIREQTNIGQKHRDHSATGNILKDNSILNRFFFGEKFDEILTLEKFLEFYDQLENEILRLEFSRAKKLNDDSTRISELEFSSLLLTYSGLSDKKKRQMLKRVNKSYPRDDRRRSPGISFDDYLKFNKFVRNIHDIDLALTFYHIAGGSIDKTIFSHVAKTVDRLELNPHLIDVVFTLFDDNEDQLLSYIEFIEIIKNRLQRGLEKPKDTAFIKLLSSLVDCVSETWIDR